MPSVPSLECASEFMRAHWHGRRYPQLVYVETTNACNARCTFCLYDRMERAVETMSFDTFKQIADKVLAADLKIGAIFCFGEPLLDNGLFEKIRYARRIGVATDYLGLNTNVSMLTPDKFHDIVTTCSNITLSFVNVGVAFEQLTKLSWDECYGNALDFIAYRDKHAPNFVIEIGCNDVAGYNRQAVRKAFHGHTVRWARDAQIEWGGKVITGVIDRSIMYHKWVCDGYGGAMQVKPNGDCCFCAYDVIRSETRYGNILVDSWEDLEKQFKQLWLQPSSLCLRCDFWWNYKQMIEGGWQRGSHIDNSWQNAYEDDRRYWDAHHAAHNVRFLSDYSLSEINEFLKLQPLIDNGRNVLDIGVGTGHCAQGLQRCHIDVDGLDISIQALHNCREYLTKAYDKPSDLPTDQYDMAIMHLVVQHMNDIDLITLMREVLRSLKDNGILAAQYASPSGPAIYTETVHHQRLGLVRRTPDHFRRIVNLAGGAVKYEVPTKCDFGEDVTDDAHWNGAHIARVREVKSIGTL